MCAAFRLLVRVAVVSGALVLLVLRAEQNVYGTEFPPETAATTGSGKPSSEPNMASWLAQHDLLYKEKPTLWDAGFHLANGDLGAVVWFKDTSIVISLDKRDIDETFSPPTAAPPEYSWERFVARMDAGDVEGARKVLGLVRQDLAHPPVGRFEVDLGASIEAFRGRFVLSTATGSAQFRLGGRSARLSCFLLPGRNVLVLSLQLDAPPPKVTVTPSPQSRAAMKDYPKAEVQREKDSVGWRQPQRNGREFFVRCHVDHPSDKQIDLFVAMTSSLENPSEPPGERIDKLILQSRQEGLSKIRERHEAWWRRYWKRSFISLPYPRMETLYYLGMYHLGATAHRDKHWPMGLQSPWGPDDHLAVGGGNTHFDLPMYYWPCYTGNQLDAVDAYCDWGFEILPQMKARGARFGWKVGQDTGALLGLIVGPDGTAGLGGPHASCWAGNGAWLSYAYWKRYLYTKDERFLRERVYPVMRACMTSYLAILRRGKDGLLHVSWGCSPEFGAPFKSWGPDGTVDLSLVRLLAGALIETVETLGLEDPAFPSWKKVLAEIAPFPVGPSGLRVWSNRAYDEQHRHLTHMFPFYPLSQMSIEGSAEEQATIARTVTNFLKFQDFNPHADIWPNWCDVYLAAVYTRLARGDECLGRLRNYEKYVGPVGLSTNYAYRPGESSRTMVLEASLGYSGVIQDMLLQSWNGLIRVFPAVPSSWRDASFRTLRAEGAFLVSSRLEGGKVSFVAVESLVGGTCRVANPYHPRDAVLWSSSGDARPLSGKIIEFQTDRGAKYTLLPVGVEASSAQGALYLPDRPADSRNLYGWPRQ